MSENSKMNRANVNSGIVTLAHCGMEMNEFKNLVFYFSTKLYSARDDELTRAYLRRNRYDNGIPKS